jgi:drug/metabolite transporter (DMT)-like permease
VVSLPGLAAAAVAVSGNLVLSLGMSLQKRHIGWIGRKPSRTPWRPAHLPPEGERRRAGRFYRDFAVWFLGFMLVNVVPAFQFFALMGLSTNVVAAIAGTSVAFTAILSKFLLRERLGKRRLAWTIVLFAAIAAAGFLGENGSSELDELSPGALFACLGIPLAAGIMLLALRGRLKGPRLAAFLAAVSGSLGGFMVFPLRALQVAAGPGFSGWLSSPYLYAFLASGISGFVLTQTAYKDGEMASVAPAYFGLQVLWPALASYFVFGAKFIPAQTLAFALVALSVAFIAGFHPAAKVGAKVAGDKRG